VPGPSVAKKPANVSPVVCYRNRVVHVAVVSAQVKKRVFAGRAIGAEDAKHAWFPVIVGKSYRILEYLNCAFPALGKAAREQSDELADAKPMCVVHASTVDSQHFVWL
jgi:hypothetical protein